MQSETEREATLEEVQLAVLRQHTQLAQLLDEVESHAAGLIKGEDCAAQLSEALVLLHRRFTRHLELEEARLVPLLDAQRQGRAAKMRTALAEHADQRARIDGLLHDRTVFNDAKTLAREALAFVHVMRVDLADEDAALRALG